MQEKYDLAVYIGRFQPFHNGHQSVIESSLDIADNTLILVGSSNASSSPKNPWSFEERKEMIDLSLRNSDIIDSTIRTNIVPINDFTYEENKWIAQVQRTVKCELRRIFGVNKCNDKRVVIVGYQRDDSSYYLNNFPQWETYFCVEHKHYSEPINGTALRDSYFENAGAFFYSHLPSMLSNATVVILKEFAKTEKYVNLQDAYLSNLEYKKSWESSPYPPIFVCTDAVVVQSGHVLLITRKNNPGKGLFAMPGGFLESNLTLFDNVIKELREETGLKVPTKVLIGSNTDVRVFDNPRRSERGRTITHTFLFELKDDEKLPRIRGGDDASKAEWIKISDINDMPTLMFEDHFHILNRMLSASK